MYRIFAIAAAALAIGSVGATRAEQVSIKVPYGDLNLSTGAGQAVLQNRIAHAINVICGERPMPPDDLWQLASYRACRRSAFASADKQLAVLNGMRMAQATNAVRAESH